MTRVLEILGHSAGGIARHVAQVHRGLNAYPSISVETAGPRRLPQEMPEPFHVVEIPDGPFGHRRAIRRLTDLAAGYDLLHGHGLRAGIDAGVAAGRAGKPSFATIHNLVRPEIAGRLKAPLYAYAEKLVVHKNDRVFCVSEEIAEHLKGRVGKEFRSRVEVTYLGIEAPSAPVHSREDLRARLGVTEDEHMVVAVARLSAQKALHIMLRAVALLERVHLVILGEGPLRADIEAQGRSLLGNRLHLLGYRPDVTDHVAAADAFCLSSIWEGVPLSVMEAILLGVPVVSTDVGGMREIVRNGVSGRLVPSGDAAALSEALREVLEDREIAATFAENAKTHVTERFSIERMLDHLAAAYGRAGA